MKEEFLQSRGIAYRTNEFSPHRPTLLFIHGLSGSASVWYPFERALEKNYNLIVPDLRGHGLSRRPASYRDYALAQYADDIATLLTHRGITTCVVVAHSFGALVVVLFIRKYQGIASRVLFLGPPFEVQDTPLAQVSGFFVHIASLLLRAWPGAPRARGRTDYAPLCPSSDWNLRRIVPDIYHMGVRPYLWCLDHIYRTNLNETWKHLTLPTLIMHGSRDTYVPVSHAERLARAIPGATLTILAGANHMLVMNNQEEIVAALRHFVPLSGAVAEAPPRQMLE